MDEERQLGGLPRPGRALKGVLAVLAAVSILGAIVVNWLPGGDAGARIFLLGTLDPALVLHQPWRLFTAGLLTSPKGFGHILMTLMGIYFLSPDLERRWGAVRFVRFLVVSVLAGWVLAIAVDAVPLPHPIFHARGGLFGATAAITATSIAWSKENANLQVRLFFFIPVSGRQLFWVTIGFCVLFLVYFQDMNEGAIAPFGGVLTGVLLSGSPSPARAAWLKLKLAVLRRQKNALTVESILEGKPTTKRPRPGAPPLRVVYGGLEDELKKRKDPKDKRHLN
jgi:membrane associated rhomboid family serine protease